MDEELDYLWETLGLEITADLWPERDKIHPTLRPAITVMQANYRRASFLIMRTSWHAALPDLKRIQAASSSCPACRPSYPRRTWSGGSASACSGSGFRLSAPAFKHTCPLWTKSTGATRPTSTQRSTTHTNGHSWRTDRGRPAGGNCVPDFKLKLVPTFPSSPQPETVSQNQRSKRDVPSAAATATPRSKPLP